MVMLPCIHRMDRYFVSTVVRRCRFTGVFGRLLARFGRTSIELWRKSFPFSCQLFVAPDHRLYLFAETNKWWKSHHPTRLAASGSGSRPGSLPSSRNQKTADLLSAASYDSHVIILAASWWSQPTMYVTRKRLRLIETGRANHIRS